MLPQFLSSRLQSLVTFITPKKKNPFSVKPLNTTPKYSTDAFLKQSTRGWSEPDPRVTPSDTDKQQIVGNLKESSRQMISSLLSLSILLMKESVAFLKEKMTMWAKLGEVCMQLILPVTSKLKAFMLQTIWMIWKNTSSNQSEQTHSSETLLSFPSKIELMNGWHDLPDGTSAIQCSTVSGRLEILYKHEYDLLTRISQVLRLDGTHILNLEECMMAYGRA